MPDDGDLDGCGVEAMIGQIGEVAEFARQLSGQEAIAVLDRDFEVFDTARNGGSPDGRISEDDLRGAVRTRDAVAAV